MSRILTFDLSAARTGWTFYDTETNLLEMGSKTFSIPKDGHPALRHREFYLWIEEMLGKYTPDLVIYEETFFQSNKAANHLHVGMYTRIEEHCAVRKIETKTISPLSLKKSFSGNHKAEKAEMQLKAQVRFPSYDMNNDKGGDVADALAILAVWLDSPSVYEPKEKKKRVKKPSPLTANVVKAKTPKHQKIKSVSKTFIEEIDEFFL